MHLLMRTTNAPLIRNPTAKMPGTDVCEKGAGP